MLPASRKVLSRSLPFPALFAVFMVCFVLTPLWNTFPGVFLKAAVLTATVVLGFLWAWTGSGTLRLITGKQASGILLFALAMAALDFRTLTASIPWRGDEDFHIHFASELAKNMTYHLGYLAGLTAFLAWALSRRKLDAPLAAGAALFAGLTALVARHAHVDLYYALRYPIFLKYMTALTVYLSGLLPFHGYPELPYRLIPLLSGGVLAWLGFHSLGMRPFAIRLVAGVAIATLPLVRYYDSLFYLEMPAVVCMTLICVSASELLNTEPDVMRTLPGWHALLLLGFLKETVLPFLAALLFCRMLVRSIRLHRNRSWTWKIVRGEFSILFCAILPLGLYLFYRYRFGNPRQYAMEPAYLVDPHLLMIHVRSIWECFGLLLPLALIGSCVAWRNRSWDRLSFLLLAFVLDFLFHALDDSQYVGYSRFNLFLLPSLLALAWEGLAYGWDRFPSAVKAALAMLVLVNLALSPLNSDGTRKPFWGVHGIDVGEHDYPYREALACLSQYHRNQKALLTGLTYGYPTEFYLGDRAWPDQTVIDKPVEGQAGMDSLLEAADHDGYQAVLYHVVGDVPSLSKHPGYGNVKVFRNRINTLVLFSR